MRAAPPTRSVAKEAPRDDQAHDVARPVPDLVELRIAEPLLDGRVAHVARAAQRLHGGPRREPGGLRSRQLRHRRLGREWAPLVGELRGVPGQQARLVELQLRVSESERDGLELVDRLPEGIAALRVLDCVFEGGAADPERVRSKLHAGPVEGAHETVEAVALLAQTSVLGDEAVLEEELARGKAAAAHLRQQLASNEALVAVLEHERRDPLRTRPGGDRREDDAEVGDGGVADELLVAVQHVAPVHAGRPRGDRGRIGAGLRLGDRERARRRPRAAERRQPPLLLLLVAEGENRPRKEPALGDHERDRAVAPGELLEDQAALAQGLDAAAAVLDGKVIAGEPDLGGLVDELPRELLRLVVVQRDRAQLLARELPRDGDQPVDTGRDGRHALNLPRRCTRNGSRSAGATSTRSGTSTTPSISATSRRCGRSGSPERSAAETPSGASSSRASRSTSGAGSRWTTRRSSRAAASAASARRACAR